MTLEICTDTIVELKSFTENRDVGKGTSSNIIFAVPSCKSIGSMQMQRAVEF
jgi:hypothetical protein